MIPKLLFVFSTKSPASDVLPHQPCRLIGGNRAFQAGRTICRMLSFRPLSFPQDKIRCLGKTTRWSCLQVSERRRLCTSAPEGAQGTSQKATSPTNTQPELSSDTL